MRKVQVNDGIFSWRKIEQCVLKKNRVDSTQKFVQTCKLALKVVKPTIENRKNLEF